MIDELIFEKLPEQTTKQLLEWPIDCECLVFKRRKLQSNSHSMEDSKYEKSYIRLQLRKNYVLHLKPEDNDIVSGFDCDIHATFKMLRSIKPDAQQVGQLLGIQFRSNKFLKKSIFVYIPEEDKKSHTQNLTKFSQLLGRKYIFQDGFHQIYRAVKKIGKGVTASVYKALRLTDRKQVAVKSFKKQIYYQIDNGRGKGAFQRQFKAMTQIDCQYVCKLISVFESDNSIYIVMELLTRSLYSYLKVNGFPSLNTSKQIMVKLLIGLGQLHKKNIMHRDLKLENIMILEKDSAMQPIIIDLGLAQMSTNSQFLYVKCGTPGYVAPEILGLKQNQIPKPPYSHQCDIFSMGVIFYILLAGKTVFQGIDERQVVRKNRQCQIDYEFPNDKKLSEQMKDMLRLMLQKKPSDRSTVDQLLNHQFFRQVDFLKQFQTRNTTTLMQQSEYKQKNQC